MTTVSSNAPLKKRRYVIDIGRPQIYNREILSNYRTFSNKYEDTPLVQKQTASKVTRLSILHLSSKSYRRVQSLRKKCNDSVVMSKDQMYYKVGLICLRKKSM